LKLSTEDKIELYYQLQESLGINNQQLSEPQMKALEAREAAIASGEMAMLSRNEFNNHPKHG